jgi:hypothetical protein
MNAFRKIPEPGSREAGELEAGAVEAGALGAGVKEAEVLEAGVIDVEAPAPAVLASCMAKPGVLGAGSKETGFPELLGRVFRLPAPAGPNPLIITSRSRISSSGKAFRKARRPELPGTRCPNMRSIKLRAPAGRSETLFT